MRQLLLLALAARLLAAQPAAIERAISRGLLPVEHSTSTFVAKRACVSCHHNILSILVLHVARERGVAFDPAVLDAVEAKTFRSLEGPTAFDDAVQGVTINDPTPDDSYLLMAAHAGGVSPDLTTAVYARRLVHWQRDGHWVTSDFRPPHSSSVFTATATAVRAVSLYMPEEPRAERDASILRARQWLARTKPQSTEDAAFRLLGLVWASAAPGEVSAASRDLLAMRKPSDGGWPELRGYPSDAYSTGQSLYALHEAGLSTADARYQAGLHFLTSTQAADGTWHVKTRMLSPADISPMYFPTGFPYEKDEFLSYAGSCWALMAMLETLPPVAAEPPPAPPFAEPTPAWARTALFGTSEELKTLLDRGLDPNSRTSRGTTVLMMAALDSDKLRLLLDRGADPKARAVSNVDALTVAAGSRDTHASIEALLSAGADANPPDGGRVKNPPLLLASMTGDVVNVKLLLAHGARPGAALAQAVTFGYPEVVRTLIEAGASATMTESSGINLLHWAAIANRAEVIPALARAGVPVNAKDENGYTPLMYAATIDFGETSSLRALLKAGADPTIRNADGFTAIEQAHRLGHVNLESALKSRTARRVVVRGQEERQSR